MDKSKILKLMRELDECAALTEQFGVDIDYLESLGNEIKEADQLDSLIRDAQTLRSRIDTVKFDVIAHAEKY